MNDLHAVSSLITRALRDPCWLPQLPPAELDLTLRLVRRVRLLGRLAVSAERAGVLDRLPTVAVDQLQSAKVAAAARARTARWELDRLAHALACFPEVPLVALKGTAYLLAGTPNAAGRLFSDVDLLVPEADLPAVESRLRGRGWASKVLTTYDDRYYREWAHEIPPMVHWERETEVDLHHNLLMRTARLKPSARLLLEAARAVPGTRFKVLAPVDMVLHAMVHLFCGGEMDDALRELVDIDDLLRHFGASEPWFWEQFWPRAEELDLARPAFYGLRYALRLLGTPLPGSVVAIASGTGPALPTRAFMDHLVPRALFPQWPNSHFASRGVARMMLRARSHWLKMPASILATHLSRKAFRRLVLMASTH